METFTRLIGSQKSDRYHKFHLLEMHVNDVFFPNEFPLPVIDELY